MNIDEFFKVEDLDLRKYLYVSGNISTNQYVKEVDNEEKIGFYYIRQELKKNMANTFYVKSILDEYLVYNKKSKKVKISNNNRHVVEKMKENYLSKDSGYFLELFTRRYTPTLCKKIIEGKIITVADLISYNRSYVIKKKHLSLYTIYKFMLIKKESLLNFIEDPENLENINDIPYDINLSIVNSGAFTCKISEIDEIREKYDKWYIEQSEKYDSFRKRRNDKVGNPIMQVSTFEIPIPSS